MRATCSHSEHVWFQKISILPSRKFRGNTEVNGGSQESKFFEGKYEAELKFPEGWEWVLEFPIKQTFHESAQSMRAVKFLVKKKAWGVLIDFFVPVFHSLLYSHVSAVDHVYQ